jgi:hypothetical protein
MKPILQFLSEEEIQLIHQSALKILGEIGFRFPFDDALQKQEQKLSMAILPGSQEIWSTTLLKKSQSGKK